MRAKKRRLNGKPSNNKFKIIMLTHTDLKKGAQFIYENQPWEVVDSLLVKMAQRRPVIQTKIKNLVDGRFQEKNFQQGDVFQEAELIKKNIKFLYSNKGKYFFSEENDPSKRFSFGEDQLGKSAKFFKPNSLVEGIIFNEKIINVKSPIKVQLKVKEAPPGIKGDRAQGGTKAAVLESGAEVQVPLFIEEGDVIEINTELGEYVKRASE